MKIIAPLIALLLLAACQTDGVGPKALSPVCDALIGPIKYTSTNKASRRYAGPDLAPDLKKRNQVGQGLHCKAFK